MVAQTSAKLYTADDLWTISTDDTRHEFEDKRYELDEGTLLEMSPTGTIHGVIALWIGHLIVSYVVDHDLGIVTGAESGFILSTNPDTVRAPDVGFVSLSRLKPLTGKFYPIAPDFAVEVVSPTDTAVQMRRKAKQYLSAGSRLVWIVYPDDMVVDVYRPNQDIHMIQKDDTLDGYDVLPGFKVSMSDLFKPLEKFSGGN